MSTNAVCQINRWVVRNHEGEVIERFNTQSKAVDYANRIQRTQQAIVLIDINTCELQLINRRASKEEIAS